jgi:hypothetical protein
LGDLGTKVPDFDVNDAWEANQKSTLKNLFFIFNLLDSRVLYFG